MVRAASTLGTFPRSFTWACCPARQSARRVAPRAWAPAPVRATGLSPWTSIRRSVRPTGSQTRCPLRPYARPGTTTSRDVAGTDDVVGVRLRRAMPTPAGGSGFSPRSQPRATSRRDRPDRAAADSASQPHVTEPQKAGVSFSITAKIYRPLHKLIAPSTNRPGCRSVLDRRRCRCAETTHRPSPTITPRCASSCPVKRPPAASWLCRHLRLQPLSRPGRRHDLSRGRHRGHAVIEDVIRDLKYGVASPHASGRFGANAAWRFLNVIAHNLGAG